MYGNHNPSFILYLILPLTLERKKLTRKKINNDDCKDDKVDKRYTKRKIMQLLSVEISYEINLPNKHPSPP